MILLITSRIPVNPKYMLWMPTMPWEMPNSTWSMLDLQYCSFVPVFKLYLVYSLHVPSPSVSSMRSRKRNRHLSGLLFWHFGQLTLCWKHVGTIYHTWLLRCQCFIAHTWLLVYISKFIPSPQNLNCPSKKNSADLKHHKKIAHTTPFW